MSQAAPFPIRQRAVALASGIVCHVSFAVAIGVMMLSIGSGFRLSMGTLPPPTAAIANFLLLAQFPLWHSFLLSSRGQRLLIRMAPLGLGSALKTTTYATLASWQLLLTFLLWTPTGVTWWQAAGSPRVAFGLMYGCSWLILLKTMYDAGLAVQTGALGWSAVARNRQPVFAPFRPRGTFRFVRQPIYVAFTLTLWTTPVWTPDGLALAVAWTAYCLVGPLFKERRYAGWHGAAWERYRDTVPYWIPDPRRRGGRPV